jgi:copper oxidase (laccase) domain-containing protein
LIEAGVPEGNIASGAPCTLTEASDFFSYRREPGERGRMVTAIRIL